MRLVYCALLATGTAFSVGGHARAQPAPAAAHIELLKAPRGQGEPRLTGAEAACLSQANAALNSRFHVGVTTAEWQAAKAELISRAALTKRCPGLF